VRSGLRKAQARRRRSSPTRSSTPFWPSNRRGHAQIGFSCRMKPCGPRRAASSRLRAQLPFQAVKGAGFAYGGPTSIVTSRCCVSSMLRGSPAYAVAVDPHCDVFAGFGFAPATSSCLSGWPQMSKKLPSVNVLKVRRLDVHDAVGRVRVQPVEALTDQRPADVVGDRDRFAVIEDRDVLVDVQHRAFHLLAVNAVDG
jgi:hypothetical protein